MSKLIDRRTYTLKVLASQNTTTAKAHQALNRALQAQQHV